MTLDTKKIRKDFPILNQTVYGRPLVFLDSAASSQKPIQVIETIDKYYRESHANIHRGVYYLSQKATDLYEKSRKKVADFIGASCPKVVIFTKNTTESINLVTNSWGRQNIHEGDEIVLTEIEHHANIVPWQMLANEKNAVLKYIPYF